MIRSSLETHPLRHVRHEISGTPSRADIALALEHALQHPNLPVLWDLTRVEIPEDFDHRERLMTVVDERRLQIPSRRRVFIVDPGHYALAQAVLSLLRLPGTWTVFSSEDESEALAWLGG